MPSKPHVCFVSDTIHTYLGSAREAGVGGAERQQYLIAQNLRERGYTVSIITLDYDEGPSPEEIEGMNVWKTIPDRRGVKAAPRKTAALFRTFRSVGADVYYVRGNDLLCAITSTWCRLFNSKFVYAVANDSNVEPEHLQSKNTVVASIYMSAIKNADAVSVLTPHQREVLASEHGINSKVIPCGYDVPPKESVLDQGDREYVLWVGRLHREQKRPERYLDIAKALPEIAFVMIGPPDNDDQNRQYFDRIRREASEIDNLEFIEFVPPDQIHEYFQRASLLVNTSAYEGFGNVFLEAWRYATPVVTQEYTLHGVIEDRDVGLQAKSHDELVEAVASLHDDPNGRSRMGSNGRELVEQEYSIVSIVDLYQELFENL